MTMNLDRTTSMEEDDEKYWREFDSLTGKMAVLVSTQIAAEHNRKYCNKTPKRTSPWKGSHKTENLLNSDNT
jgi:hypothetical protein